MHDPKSGLSVLSLYSTNTVFDPAKNLLWWAPGTRPTGVATSFVLLRAQMSAAAFLPRALLAIIILFLVFDSSHDCH